MKNFRFLLTGIILGITLTKGEVISWYRIQEMFRFQSFHMYGVIGSAIAVGLLIIQFIKSKKLNTIDKTKITIIPKKRTYRAGFLGGIIFGLGWAMTGACPAPIYMNIGYGYTIFIIVLISAFLGTLVYGVFQKYLPK